MIDGAAVVAVAWGQVLQAAVGLGCCQVGLAGVWYERAIVPENQDGTSMHSAISGKWCR